VLTTDADLAVGWEAQAGTVLTLGPRSLVLLRQT
jgi:hypothetical protein